MAAAQKKSCFTGQQVLANILDSDTVVYVFVDSDDDSKNEDSYLHNINNVSMKMKIRICRVLTMLVAQQTLNLVGIIPAILGSLMMVLLTFATFVCLAARSSA